MNTWCIALFVVGGLCLLAGSYCVSRELFAILVTLGVGAAALIGSAAFFTAIGFLN